MPKHDASQTKEILKKIVTYLENPGKDPVDRDDVKNYLVDQHVIDKADTIILSEQDLLDLKQCLHDQDKDLNVNIIQAVGERIWDEVHEYYVPTAPETQAHQVGDLTVDQAYNLAIYFKGLKNAIEVSSNDLKKDGKIPAEAKVPYTSLNAFVKYLNEEKKENIPVTIKMTTDERIYDEIEKYLTSHPITGLDANAAYAMVSDWRTKPEGTNVNTEGVKSDYGIDMTFKQLDNFVKHLKDEKKEDIRVVAKMTQDEQLMFDIGEYLSDQKDTETAIENTQKTRNALSNVISSYLKGLDTNTVVTTASIAAVAAGVVLDLTYPQLEALVNSFMGKDGVPNGITVKRTTKENVGEYLKTYNIATLPETTNEEVETAKTKLCEVVTILNNKVEAAGEEATEVITTTDDVKEKVVFTYEELNDFVKYMQKDGVDEVSDKIKVEKTDPEKIDYAIDAYITTYLPSNAVTGLPISTDAEKAVTKTKLQEIVTYLENQGSETVTSDNVNEKVSGVVVTYDNLVELKEKLAAEGKNLEVNIIQTDKERITQKAAQYLVGDNKIEGLNADDAYKIIDYLQSENKNGNKVTVYDLKQAGLIPVGAAVTYKVLSALVNHLNNNGETIPEIQTANARETDLRDEINTILASNFRPDSVADGVAFDDTVFDELIGGTEEVSGADVENILLAKTASNVFSANADWWKQDASAVSDAASLDSQITAVFPNSVLASEGDEGYDTLQTGIQSFVDAYNSSSASDAGNTELSNILTESNKLSALNLASTRSTIKTSLSSDTTKESKVEAFQDALPSCIKKVRDYALAFGIEDKDSRDYIIENYPSSTVDDFKNTILPEKGEFHFSNLKR